MTMEGSTGPGERDPRAESPDWGHMGGTPGDGLAGTAAVGAPPPPQAPVPATPPPPPLPDAPPSHTPGGITRFATPELVQQHQRLQQQQQQSMSYAARSAQSMAHYTAQQQAVASQQGFPYDATSGSAQQQPPVISAGSYAARSQQAYHQQQQQPVYNPYASPQVHQQPQQYTPANPASAASGSYTARSQAAYQPQPQPSPTVASTSVASTGAPSYTPQPASAYSQPRPPLPQTPVMTAAAAPGSFAARSAQAHAQQQHQQELYATPGSMVATAPPPPNQHMTPTPQVPSNVYTPTAAVATPVPYPPPQQHQPPSVQGTLYSPAAPSAAVVLPSNMYTPQAQGVPQPQTPYTSPPQPQQQQQQPHMYPPPSEVPPPPVVTSDGYATVSSLPAAAAGLPPAPYAPDLHQTQQQQRLLTDAVRKVQEHAYYMKQAMEQRNLPVVLDRAAHLAGELGGPPHGPQHHHHHGAGTPGGTGGSPGGTGAGGPANTGNAARLNPKHYYELYMRVLDEMPALEDYLLGLVQQALAPDAIRIVDTARAAVVRTAPYTMRELYDCTQYCPRVVSRLYLQIAAGSALIRSGEASAKWVMQDLQQVVRCEQNPIRGLFLRHYLLTALRDKLPDTPAPLPGAPTLETIVDNEELEDGVESATVSETHAGTVKDSYEFVLDNLKEMNKLWVRIQHLPGEGRNKDVKKRRERERNDLRMIVGTNLVRLSQLECVTSKIYGEYILPQILDHIVVFGDPLSQAYMMDCLVQVFPDEYHIETMPILLSVCPRLRDKVNIRTILQGLMDRLANYLAEEELLDETDTNQVKRALARDSFSLFEDCIYNVYNSRGPKLTSKEVIRLQSGLLQFSIKCFPGNMDQVARALIGCIKGLRQANTSYDIPDGTMASVPDDKLVPRDLDPISVTELEKLLSIPLDSLGLQVLELDPYSDLVTFLPWLNRRQVAIYMLEAVSNLQSAPRSVHEIEKLFSVIEPVLVDQADTAARAPGSAYGLDSNASQLMVGLGVNPVELQYSNLNYDPERLLQLSRENSAVSKLVHLLNHENMDIAFEMLKVAQNHICKGGPQRALQPLVALVFASSRLAECLFRSERGLQTVTGEPQAVSDVTKGAPEGSEETLSEQQAPITAAENNVSIDTVISAPSDIAKSVTCRKLMAFAQETIGIIAKGNSETAVKLYLELSLIADGFIIRAKPQGTEGEYSFIAYELISEAFGLYEDAISESKAQLRCIKLMIGTLLASRSLSKEEYERLITKAAQFSAKVLKKNEQCELVTQCALLFYAPDPSKREQYSNPQRALECLQRALKLADACTSSNPSNAYLFVELLETYILFFEQSNPSISPAYINGMVALVREHTVNGQGDPRSMAQTKSHFMSILQHIKEKKGDDSTAELYAPVQIDTI